ncbi:mannose-1-phosphate guanylyltransferase [Turicibacter sanguinis]|uniref:mannose-1-phosphate guanylyltransferase n=1 Tax=Turicibacter sanguinis TaxID=154288 RepID=UPI0018AA47D4|nr:mannose-1-phosphate guanylyltransferase [Turicibacter sanguinis]MDB8558555.1 mannose-1-phosphate guanylyltransferase [Turicibacter sanguinis]MDB8561351.1 mannose-1-phosphate guanylyltransferase [Turicibacter sanguinis]
MLCALIMAGGKGTRFWPLSTEENPKQFLNLVGDESMIQMTVNRIKELIPIERIFVVTDKKYEDLVNYHLTELPRENIIIEPMGMNTAPCIALSAMMIESKFPNATLAVLPSDHLIQDEQLFRKTLAAANHFVEMNNDAVVTLGMKVVRPETGYGYIKYSQSQDNIFDLDIKSVEKFVEKPDQDTAKNYMEDGNYLWNGGMFIWKAQNVINLTQKHLPKTFVTLNKVMKSSKDEFISVLNKEYSKVDSISVDYGIMEKVENICVIPSEFGWDDVGSWLSLERYKEKDFHQNIFDGPVKLVESKGNIAISKTKPMLLCGVEDLILVETEEVIMVMKKDNVDQISQLRTSFDYCL